MPVVRREPSRGVVAVTIAGILLARSCTHGTTQVRIVAVPVGDDLAGPHRGREQQRLAERQPRPLAPVANLRLAFEAHQDREPVRRIRAARAARAASARARNTRHRDSRSRTLPSAVGSWPGTSGSTGPRVKSVDSRAWLHVQLAGPAVGARRGPSRGSGTWHPTSAGSRRAAPPRRSRGPFPPRS